MAIARTVVFGNINFIETDLAVYNCKESIKRGYGQTPILWRKLVNNLPESGEGKSYYLLSAIVWKGQRGVAQLSVELGDGSIPSKLCGRDAAGVLNKPYSGDDRYTTIQYDGKPYLTPVKINRILSPALAESASIDAIPDIRTRGVLSNAEGASSVMIGTEGDFIYNISKEDLLTRVKNYLYAVQKDPSQVDDTEIRFFTRGSTASAKVLRTIDDLIDAFPRYFSYDEEFKRQAQASITAGTTNNKFFADNTWWPTSFIGLWDSLASKSWIGENEVEGYLINEGYSLEQIKAIRSLKGVTAYVSSSGTSSSGGTSSTGTGGGSRPSSSSTTGGVGPDRNPWLGPEGYSQGSIQDITVQRSRNLFLTSDDFESVLTAQNISLQPGQSVMYQIYLQNSTPNLEETARNAIINQYVFDMTPNEIAYSGLGSEWATIERTGGFPFIDWKNFKLLQVSFSFVIANKNSPVTADGLESPITEQINKLQRMAQTPYPVMFYGFDTLLTNQFRYDEQGTPRGIQFIIQDLNIAATRRNANMEITRAQANITLQEIPIERQSLIGMPRLTHKTIVPAEPTTTTPEEQWGLFTSQTPARNTTFTTPSDIEG